MLALRQAGFAPVVASMGTALTEAQLRELARLTKRLFLCFDADAAGQDATLRGMELAVAQGFDVNVVPLPPGTDPADDPAAFERAAREPRQLSGAPGAAAARKRAATENAAFAAIERSSRAARLAGASRRAAPGHRPARPSAGDPGGARAAATRSRAAGVISPRLLDAGQRLERSALAGVAAHESLLPELERLGPEQFDDELNRRARAYLLGQEAADGELKALLAELYALGDEESITLETARQLLLRLRERGLQRELARRRRRPPRRAAAGSSRSSATRSEPSREPGYNAAADPR